MIPFDKIGPGQSIRLAWQVMGKNGPIPNPAGIRYLPADTGVILGGAKNLLYASTALAGLNLIASVANTAIAVQSLQELRKVSKRLEDLTAGQRRIEAKVEQAIAGIKRVEIGVSEARLARVVSKALHAAREDDGLNFEPFHQLSEDLQSFLDDAGIVRGRVTSLRLGSDLRNDLQNLAALLRGVRLRLATHWNHHQVDPAYVWRCEMLDDYWSTAEMDATRLRAVGAHDAAIAMVCSMATAHRTVNSCFSFNDSSDHAKIHDALVTDALWPMWESLTGVDGTTFRESLNEMESVALERVQGRAAADVKTLWLDDDYLKGYLDAAGVMSIIDANITSSTGEIPPSIFFLDDSGGDLGFDVVLKDFRRWWLYSTDDGIVYRAWLECAGVAHGYSEVWPEIAELAQGQMAVLPEPEPVRIELEAEDRDAPVAVATKPARRFR